MSGARWLFPLLLLAACRPSGSSVQYFPLNPIRAQASRPPEEIAVLDDVPPGRVLTLGVIEVTRYRQQRTTSESLMKQLRVEAARRGCEAVVLLGSDTAVAIGDHEADPRGIRASCIVLAP